MPYFANQRIARVHVAFQGNLFELLLNEVEPHVEAIVQWIEVVSKRSARGPSDGRNRVRTQTPVTVVTLRDGFAASHS